VGLPTVQILGSPEVREVPVVIQDLYCILSPSRTCLHSLRPRMTEREFLVMDFIVPFSCIKAFRGEAYQMPFTVVA